jgi:hypothetical protein
MSLERGVTVTLRLDVTVEDNGPAVGLPEPDHASLPRSKT